VVPAESRHDAAQHDREGEQGEGREGQEPHVLESFEAPNKCTVVHDNPPSGRQLHPACLDEAAPPRPQARNACAARGFAARFADRQGKATQS
jgi:hypothetical protein